MKSKKVTKEMLDEAGVKLNNTEVRYSMAAHELNEAKKAYIILVKRASASVVKEHTLKKG